MLHRKLLGLESALTAPAAQMHFSIPCVPLPANTLIITSLGNVHSQKLLVRDSIHFSIHYLVMRGEGNVLCFDVVYLKSTSTRYSAQ